MDRPAEQRHPRHHLIRPGATHRQRLAQQQAPAVLRRRTRRHHWNACTVPATRGSLNNSTGDCATGCVSQLAIPHLHHHDLTTASTCLGARRCTGVPGSPDTRDQSAGPSQTTAPDTLQALTTRLVSTGDRGTLDRAGRHRNGPLLDQRSRSAPGRATAVGAEPVSLRRGRPGDPRDRRRGDARGSGRRTPRDETGGMDPLTASGTIAGLVRLPNGQLLAIASCALRAF